MSDTYRFSFDHGHNDTAQLVAGMPTVRTVEDEYDDGEPDELDHLEFATPSRAVAIQISGILTAEDVSFSMRAPS